MKPNELDDTQWRSVLQGLALAEYSLVLGAGASLSAKNERGAELLSGNGLRDKLLKHYNIPGGAATPLRQIYDLADTVAQSRGDLPPKDIIAPLFSGCTVPQWYGNLVTIPWRVIWNLNIDDVLINAYRTKFRNRARQELRVMSWRDRWTSTRDPLDKVSMIHLHGDANKRDVVFGSLEYLAAAREGGAAHRIFWDEWASGSPTVVVGASLDDEIDLAASIHNPLASNRPSIIVKPSFSEFDEFRLLQSGLIPVRMSAEAFFGAVSDDWENTLSEIQPTNSPGTLGINPSLFAFLRTFHTPRVTDDRWHDFYAGDEPAWKDLQESLDAKREIAKCPDPTNPIGHEGLRIYAFHGELSGTTTAEMRFLRDAVEAGHEVLEYAGDGKFDARAIHWMAKQGMRKLLRVPRLEDYGDVAAELEALCKQSGVPVTLVSSMRTSKFESFRLPLDSSLCAVRVPDKLSATEVDALVDRLGALHRLNVILPLDRKGRRDFILKTHRASLIDSVASITHGKTFAARYEEAYRDVGQSADRQILDAMMVASEARYDVSFGVLARAANISPSDLRRALSTFPLARLVTTSPQGVSARHWGLAAQAAKGVLTPERRFETTTALARALAPYVHPTTISQKTKEVALCARLMDGQRVVDSFGSERGAALYDELEAEYAWNSRFWEQRALAELEAKMPRWERAEAWAREAVVRHEDGLSLNTLATVLLRSATSGESLDEGIFFEGLEVVDAARVRSRDRVTEHPFITAFSYLRRGRSLVTDDATLRQIDQIFNFWRLQVERSEAWAHPTMRNDLTKSIEQYLTARF